MKAPRVLGYTALALGLAAPFAGSPDGATRGRIDVDALAGEVARGEDHVDALELARWIRARKPGLRVIDLRSADERDPGGIPGAEFRALESLSRAVFAPGDTIVLVSDSGIHAGQAWVLLRAMGLRQVYVLQGGISAWQDDVMNPLIAAEATEAERQAFERTAELSRYFGGSPGVGTRRDAAVGRGDDAGRGRAPSPRRVGC